MVIITSIYIVSQERIPTNYQRQFQQLLTDSSNFWATVCKTVRPMLSDGCLSVCSVCPVCLYNNNNNNPICKAPECQKTSVALKDFRDVGVLRPNGWMDQDETWHACRPRALPHCVRRGPTSPPQNGHSPPIFGPHLLWPNGWMD